LSLSIIIPTLNEESCLAETLRSLRGQSPVQIIVADGGSSDGTCHIASDADVLVRGQRGRGAQMNAGARRATGDVLLFLHADCRLEEGALADAERRLASPGVVAGCFTMHVTEPGALFRMIGGAATTRVRLTGIAYGDQGFFVLRELFNRVGGFPAYRFMEDVFMSRTLRRWGRIVVSSRRIFVSPRRWQKTGVIRQTLRNWTFTSLALAGVHPDRLADWYPLVR
jgi:rSAM/selenodomain-associated transferase 2